MKSKAFILMEIRELLVNNVGLDYAQVESAIQDLEKKTIFELLTIKKDIKMDNEYADVTILRSLFRD